LIVLYLMNTKKFFTNATLTLAASCLISAPLSAQDETTEVVEVSAETPAVSPEAYLELYGYLVGQQTGVGQMQLTDEQVAAFEKGLATALAGQPRPASTANISQEQFQSYMENLAQQAQERMMQQQQQMQAQMQAQFADQAAANKAKGSEYVASLGEEWQQLPSGVYYKVVEKGEEPLLEATDTAMVQYKGELIDGTVFDESDEGESVPFPLQNVIPGFREGLQQIGKGGTVELVIPADQGYGDMPRGPIPAGSTLVFEVTVTDVQE